MSRFSREGSVLCDTSDRRQAVTSQGPYNTKPDVNWAVKAWPGLEPPTVSCLWAEHVDKKSINTQIVRQEDRHMGKAQARGNIARDVKCTLSLV